MWKNPHSNVIDVCTICLLTGFYSEIVGDFTAIIPFVSFKCYGFVVKLVFDTSWPYCTAQYLKVYAKTDRRVRLLCVTFRYLAKVSAPFYYTRDMVLCVIVQW